MISGYMDQAAVLFWDYPIVTIVQCLAEWFCFLWYIHTLSPRSRKQTVKVLISLVFFAASMVLHLQNYKIILYFPIYMLLCIGFLWLNCKITLPRAVFKISPFGLGMELCRLLCRDGFLTCLLAYLQNLFSGLVSIFLCIGLYVFLLIPTTVLMRKITVNFEKLEVTVTQLLGFVFPMILYIIVRQTTFYYLPSLGLTQWLQLELLQLAILAYAELELIAAGRMAAAQLERSELLEKQILYEKQQQQYAEQIKAIDTINRRYHDLKHYLSAMETMNAGELNASVRAIRQEIETYECMQKTGNNTLDILLSERMRECQKKGIRLVPYIDARQAGFIQIMDLCVIFGNAMDNAIEATEALKYVNMKEISIKITASGQLLILHFHNYYDGDLRYEGEKLLTKKSDRLHHGFGLESIRETVAKYNGTVAHEANGNEFSLNILIPIPDEQKS